MENTKKDLIIDLVIDQVKADIESGDYTALIELLNMCPINNLKTFLSEYTGE